MMELKLHLYSITWLFAPRPSIKPWIFEIRSSDALSTFDAKALNLRSPTFDAKALGLRSPISDTKALDLRSPIFDAKALDLRNPILTCFVYLRY